MPAFSASNGNGYVIDKLHGDRWSEGLVEPVRSFALGCPALYLERPATPPVTATNVERAASLKKVILYTDGACSGNPGPGGWACLLIFGQHERVLTGYVPETTNNRMEMAAVVEGLRVLKERCHVLVHSDSSYVINAFLEGWIPNWIKRGWKTAGKKPVKNRDLWEELIAQVERHNVEWVKVKGHADDDLNNRVDGLAVLAREEGASRR
ncbi:MAG: ribonuclease HI [Rhodothermales bacterium]